MATAKNTEPTEPIVAAEEAVAEPVAAEEAVAEPAAAEEAVAEPAAAEQENRPDETIPGGRYLVGNQLVNANGKPIRGSKEGED